MSVTAPTFQSPISPNSSTTACLVSGSNHLFTASLMFSSVSAAWQQHEQESCTQSRAAAGLPYFLPMSLSLTAQQLHFFAAHRARRS